MSNHGFNIPVEKHLVRTTISPGLSVSRATCQTQLQRVASPPVLHVTVDYGLGLGAYVIALRKCWWRSSRRVRLMELDVTAAQCAGRSYVSIGQSKTKSVGSAWLPVINQRLREI